MSTISAENTILITNTTYTADSGRAITLPTWPITIINTGVNVVVVRFSSGITYSSKTNYFICGSNNITFDGQNNTININGVTGWLGLIQNGVSATNGYNYINIQNISINIISTTLSSESGYICQGYFNPTLQSCIISNCNNNGTINNTNCGGICAAFSNNLTISNCYNTGNITSNSSGGICGSSNGSSNRTIIISNCYNKGNISGTGSGGICGYSMRNTTITNCFNTGNINGNECGGIAGSGFGIGTGNAIIQNCYNIGNINSNNSAGICGRYPASESCITTINNSYSIGIVTAGAGICGSNSGNGTINITNCYCLYGNMLGTSSIATITNSYTVNGNWFDSSANSILSVGTTPPNIYTQGTIWTSVGENTPYLLTGFNTIQTYNPNIAMSINSSYTSAAGSFSSPYKYKLLSVNNAITPSNISINTTNGILTFTYFNASTYTENVITSLFDICNNYYGYNFGTFTLKYETGYNISGVDLITIFEPYTSGTTITTGFYNTSISKDLGAIFQPYATGSTQAAVTNYKISNGSDLNTLFSKIKYTYTIFAYGSTVKTEIVNGYQLILFKNNSQWPASNLSGTFSSSITIIGANILIVGGGGGGGDNSGSYNSGGGGGAGGSVSQLTNQTINENTSYTVQVGAGGAGGNSGGTASPYLPNASRSGLQGGSSIWNTTTVLGGAGGSPSISASLGGAGGVGANGGSSGGAGGAYNTSTNSVNGTNSGLTTITGVGLSYYFSGGGSGGAFTGQSTGGNGGLGGGGGGGNGTNANNGQAYTGPIDISYAVAGSPPLNCGYPYTGGGGAGGNGQGSLYRPGGNGGSGLVLISYPLFLIGSGLSSVTAGSTLQYPINSQYNLLYITAGTGTVTLNTNIIAFILVGGGGGGNAGTQGTSLAQGPGSGGQVTIVNNPSVGAYTFTIGAGGLANANGSNTTAVIGATTYTATGGSANNTAITTGVTGTLVTYNNLYYGGSGNGGLGGGGGLGGNGSNIYQGGVNNPGSGASGGGISVSLTGGAGGTGNTGGNGFPGTNSFYGGGGGGGGRNSGSASGGAGGSGILNTGTGGGNAGGAAYTSSQGGAGAGGNGGINTGGGGGLGGQMAGNPNGLGYASGGAGGSGIIIVILQK